MPMKTTAIILAAGKGTRMKSALPKPLHPVGGRPMLAWALDAAMASGAEQCITVLPKDSAATQEWLGDAPVAIQDPPLGTGHAVIATETRLKHFDGLALVMFADTPLVTAGTLKQLCNLITDGNDVGVLGFDAEDPNGYGRLITNDNGHVEAIIEHNDASDEQRDITLVNGGIMAIRCPLLFDMLTQITPNNTKGELYLTDIVAIAHASGHSVKALVTDESEVMGVNDRVDLAVAEALLQDRLRMAALEAGVTMHAPETVFLHADAIIESDVTIEPHVVIGQGCHIGEGSVLRAFSHLEGAILGKCCIIGPYARLRPGTVAAEGVKIGNFVETKNAELGAGAKANHLSYLGDAEVGAAANIGAGTITCNYDGKNKNKTTIGKNSFVGSNSTIIAPIKIGENVTMGAGSTFNKDIPNNTLAIGRAYQINKKKKS